MTRHIYKIDGEPDGSGIANHLVLEPLHQTGNHYTAVLGVPEGKPTMLMIVQDQGATVPVSDKMRGFLAAQYGIFLKSSTIAIIIPGRGVWQDSWHESKIHIQTQLDRFFETLFRG
jgi:hypothetical protein